MKNVVVRSGSLFEQSNYFVIPSARRYSIAQAYL